MKQMNEMSARALSKEELEQVNGGFPLIYEQPDPKRII